MSFDINMNMAGILPSTGGGGQFPANTDDVPYHRCAIKSGERKVNAKQSGEVVQLILEGRSREVSGMSHKVTINIAHVDPEVAKRGAQDMLAYVYAALGVQQIGNAGALFGREIGVVVSPDPANKEGENYTRINHVVFADGRPLVVNGQLQPFTVNPAGNSFGGGNQQPQFNQQTAQQPQQQQQTAQQTQGNVPTGFASGASVQQSPQFQTGQMQRPTDQQSQQQQQQADPNAPQGYQSPGGYQQQAAPGGSGLPSWAG